jgi:aerobic C4-dicarboxylate transport protein
MGDGSRREDAGAWLRPRESISDEESPASQSVDRPLLVRASRSTPETISAGPKRRGARALYVQVLVGIALGVAVGALAPGFGAQMKPLGDAFVKLVKMLISPIVFTTVVLGVASMGDLKKVGRIGGKALLYFEVMTTVALVLGVGAIHIVRPGRGVHARAELLDPKALDAALLANKPKGLVEHLLAIIPDSLLSAFTSGDVLQVLLVALLVGAALAALGPRSRGLIEILEQVSTGLFAVVSLVMRAAPLGAFGAMAFTIGKFGLGTLGNLAGLMATFYATALVFVFVVLGIVVRLLGLNIFKLIVYLRDELVLVLGTSSSEPALPRLMAKLEALGCRPDVVRLVVPTGYSFNLDGTCIYLTMAALFVAEALDVELSLRDQLVLLGVLLLTSKGAAGVTGSGFVTLAATLAATGKVPVVGLTLLLGIDRFMSEARALTNFVGNAVATLVVARWEGALDLEKARAVLDARPRAGAPERAPAGGAPR